MLKYKSCKTTTNSILTYQQLRAGQLQNLASILPVNQLVLVAKANQNLIPSKNKTPAGSFLVGLGRNRPTGRLRPRKWSTGQDDLTTTQDGATVLTTCAAQDLRIHNNVCVGPPETRPDSLGFKKWGSPSDFVFLHDNVPCTWARHHQSHGNEVVIRRSGRSRRA